MRRVGHFWREVPEMRERGWNALSRNPKKLWLCPTAMTDLGIVQNPMFGTPDGGAVFGALRRGGTTALTV